MPYIKQDARHEIDGYAKPTNAGELNYLFTITSINYWDLNGKNYQAFNDIIGALEGCKLELYRRMVAPYEDTKIEENGDIHGYGPRNGQVRAEATKGDTSS